MARNLYDRFELELRLMVGSLSGGRDGCTSFAQRTRSTSRGRDRGLELRRVDGDATGRTREKVGWSETMRAGHQGSASMSAHDRLYDINERQFK